MIDKYLLEKCNIDDFVFTKEKLVIYYDNALSNYSNRDYLYWDKVKYKDVPEGIEDNKDLWGLLKFMRHLNYTSPVKNEDSEYFKFGELEFSKELLHEIDKNASGTFYTPFSESDKRLFIANGMLEEAISSSQLEGASTTSRNAIKMIQEGRKPVNDDERMIINNFEVMNFVKSDLSKKKEIDEADLLYIQETLTKGISENEGEIGRFRNINDEKDPIVVKFQNRIAHTPMPAVRMREELKVLLDFMNDKGGFGTFVHPVIKAIIIHFWIGYLHPFCDGNGRTARAMFYWYLLKNEYFGFSFIPLSSIIKNSPIDYAKSYIYTEQDDLDLTYFINYNLRKIEIALNKFQEDIKKRFQENHNDLKDLRHLELNERQKRLISYFLEKKDSYTNSLIHKNYYHISKPTAISDLKGLQKIGYIYSVKSGRNISYYPSDNLHELIKKD